MQTSKAKFKLQTEAPQVLVVQSAFPRTLGAPWGTQLETPTSKKIASPSESAACPHGFDRRYRLVHPEASQASPPSARPGPRYLPRGSACHSRGDLTAFSSALRRHILPGLRLGLPTHPAPFLTTARLKAPASPSTAPGTLVWRRRRRATARPTAWPRGHRQSPEPGFL